MSTDDSKPINPKMLEGECIVCAKAGIKVPLSIPFPPIVALHHQTCDIVTVPHTKGVICKICKTYYNALIINANIEMTLAPQTPFVTNEDQLIQIAHKVPN